MSGIPFFNFASCEPLKLLLGQWNFNIGLCYARVRTYKRFCESDVSHKQTNSGEAPTWKTIADPITLGEYYTNITDIRHWLRLWVHGDCISATLI